MEARCIDDIDTFIIFIVDKDAHCGGNHQLLNASSTKRSSTYTVRINCPGVLFVVLYQFTSLHPRHHHHYHAEVVEEPTVSCIVQQQQQDL
jgi:hypothetical protein